ESDRVVTLFGRTTGRVSALARGARKSQRRFAGGLGLGSVGEISVRERSGAELLTLESFDVTASHPTFGTDVARMAHAAYAAELVTKLCAPRQVEVAVYDLLARFLDLLDAAGASAERVRVFELGLLGRLGFGPMVAACAVCGGTRSPPAPTEHRWDPDRGGAATTWPCTAEKRPARATWTTSAWPCPRPRTSMRGRPTWRKRGSRWRRSPGRTGTGRGRFTSADRRVC